jgi:EpsI family protein
MTERRAPQSLARPLEAIPHEFGAWQTKGQETLDTRVLEVLKPTSYLSRFYKAQDKTLGLFIAFYERQTAGATLHSPKNCVPGGGWEIWKQNTLKVALNSKPVVINRYSIRRGDAKMVMYYWYQSKGHVVASEVAGKFYLVRDSLISGNTAAALVRLTVPDTSTADEEASGFAERVIPQIQACFGN